MEKLHVKIAKNLLNLKEIGNNRAFTDKEFEKHITKFGWRQGHSWCSYFVAFCVDVAGATKPAYRGGLARGWYSKGFSPYKDPNLIEEGDIVIWRKGTGITGHVAIITKKIDDKTIETIEGNTSSGEAGSQDNGDGVYIRKRKIQFDNPKFHIYGFSKVSYE